MENKKESAQSGITLIEMAVVLVIIGLVVGVSAQLGTSQLDLAKRHNNREKLVEIESAMARFVAVNHRLPCPDNGQNADGREDREDDGSCSNQQVFGVVPYVTLGLRETFATDAYQRFFTYRVYDNPRYGLTRDNGLDMSQCRNSTPINPISDRDLSPFIINCTENTPPRDYLYGKGLTIMNENDDFIMDSYAENPMGAAYIVISHGENQALSLTHNGIISAGEAAPLEWANSAAQALYDDHPQDFEAYRAAREVISINNPEIYFDDLVLRPSIMQLAEDAHLEPN